MILISIRFFQRLLNSFNAVFTRETSTALQGKSQKDSRQVLVCLPFVDRNTILPIADDVFILKVPNKQGILLFVHQMLT